MMLWKARPRPRWNRHNTQFTKCNEIETDQNPNIPSSDLLHWFAARKKILLWMGWTDDSTSQWSLCWPLPWHGVRNAWNSYEEGLRFILSLFPLNNFSTLQCLIAAFIFPLLTKRQKSHYLPTTPKSQVQSNRLSRPPPPHTQVSVPRGHSTCSSSSIYIKITDSELAGYNFFKSRWFGSIVRMRRDGTVWVITSTGWYGY